MNEKQLTLQDITMEDVYRYLYCANHCNEPTFCESQVDELFPKKPYFITNISQTELTYCMDHQYHTIPVKPLNIHAASLLTLLTQAHIIQNEIMEQLQNLYKNYVPLLQLQMDLEHVLKHDVFYDPFNAGTVYNIVNPIGPFTREVKTLQGTSKKGQYYDDKWDDSTYMEKVEQYKTMSIELFDDKPELHIPKQGNVQEIQNLLYKLQQSLPSMTGIQTYMLRNLCFPYNSESIVFAMYKNLNNYITNTDNATIANYLWYFMSHDDKYRYLARHMETHNSFYVLRHISISSSVENGFDLLQSLAKNEDDIYPFLKHVVPYKFLTLYDEGADIQEDFEFDDNDPSEIEKLFEESLSEEILDENCFTEPPCEIKEKSTEEPPTNE